MSQTLVFKQFLETSQTFKAYSRLKRLERELGILTGPYLSKGKTLSYLESLILLAIYWGPENQATPKNLSTPFHISPSQISQLLLQLDQKDLIQRKISLKDSRERQIVLTRRARPLIAPLINFFEREERS